MARLREWISVELERDDRKKVAVLLVQVCIQVGLRVKEASAIAGELVGKTERTVREWRQDFFCNQGCFSEYQRGKYVCPSIIDYITAYREGHVPGRQLEDAVKQYKSHRRVPKDM